MDGEPRFRRPNTPLGDFHRSGGFESTRIAKVIARPRTEPIPADELARLQAEPDIFDADEVGVELHVSGVHRQLEDVHDADDVGASFDQAPVEIPLATRSLIPADILE